MCGRARKLARRRQNVEFVKLVCPRCGFTIEQYRSEELETIRRKYKRYQYLLNKSNICPICLASGRLKELRAGEAEPVWNEQALSSVSSEDKAEIEDFAIREGYGEITAATVEKSKERTE